MNDSHRTQIEKYGGQEGYAAEMRRRQALSVQRQVERYGSVEAYRAEMRRRRALRTNYRNAGGFQYLKKTGQVDKINQLREKGLKVRRQKRGK